MMERMGANPGVAVRIDKGNAWYEARTKCVSCWHEYECRNWLEGSEVLQGPTDFCPNVAFFQRCARTSAHAQSAAPRVAA